MRFNPQNGQLDFFTCILVVVCSGLPAFHRFDCLSSNSRGGLCWFVVVCGGLSYIVILIPLGPV